MLVFNIISCVLWGMTVSDKMNITVLFGSIALTSGFPLVLDGCHKPFFIKDFLTFSILSEKAKPGYLIGMSSAMDHDNDRLSYTLVGQDAEYFRYDATDSGIYVEKTLPSDKLDFTFNIKAEDKDYNKAYQIIVIEKSKDKYCNRSYPVISIMKQIWT